MRQLYALATGDFVRNAYGLAASGLSMRVVDRDDERDLYRVLLTGDGLPAEFEVADGAYPKEANVRFVRNALDGRVIVFASETHDAMGW